MRCVECSVRQHTGLEYPPKRPCRDKVGGETRPEVQVSKSCYSLPSNFMGRYTSMDGVRAVTPALYSWLGSIPRRPTKDYMRRRKHDLGNWSTYIHRRAQGYVKCRGTTDMPCSFQRQLGVRHKHFRIPGANVLLEIQKCVILCSNCHQKYHAGRFTIPFDYG